MKWAPQGLSIPRLEGRQIDAIAARKLGLNRMLRVFDVCSACSRFAVTNHSIFRPS